MRRAGALISLGYLAVAAATFAFSGLKVRPFFDGSHGGVAYRWVDPPPSEEPFNLPPSSGEGEVELTRRGSRDTEVATLDKLASALFPSQAFDAVAGEPAVEVTIEPLDPDDIGPVPTGKEFQGNAYRYVARYARSGDAAPLSPDCSPDDDARCPTVLLTVPFGATDLARWDGDAWVTVPDMVESSPYIFAFVNELGTYVGLAEEGRIASITAGLPPPSGFPLRDVIAIGAGGVATVGLSIWYRRRLTAQRREEVKRRAAGRKYKPAQAKKR